MKAGEKLPVRKTECFLILVKLSPPCVHLGKQPVCCPHDCRLINNITMVKLASSSIFVWHSRLIMFIINKRQDVKLSCHLFGARHFVNLFVTYIHFFVKIQNYVFGYKNTDYLHKSTQNNEWNQTTQKLDYLLNFVNKGIVEIVCIIKMRIYKTVWREKLCFVSRVLLS